MKKSVAIIFASFLVIGGASVATFGQTEGANKPKPINQRQENQRDRIRDGVQNDEINRNELKRLAKEQAQIRQLERRVRSDGDVTLRERGKLQRELNQSSRHINRAKRN